jgi:UV DNA damage endonuclease
VDGIRIGYACVNTGLPSSSRTTRLANATPERLRELTAANLDALERILRWNAAHGIRVFRLTSNLVPFASHPVNGLRWWGELAPRLAEIGALAQADGMRLSTHPGQYTVLASTSPAVVEAAVGELDYHGRLLSALRLDRSHKIVVHVGPTGGARDEIQDRFAAAFARLSPEAAGRLALENDERWPLADVLPLARRLGLPVVFDVFHHEIAPSLRGLTLRDVVLRAARTWTAADGRPEVHFSTQDPGKRPGAHAQTLDLGAFARFVAAVGDLPLDCVLEVKDKERSVLRWREATR